MVHLGMLHKTEMTGRIAYGIDFFGRETGLQDSFQSNLAAHSIAVRFGVSVQDYAVVLFDFV
jgi:hypothetical protein